MIHAHPEPADFIERKKSSPSKFIYVRRQASGNLNILHWVVTCTKRIKATTLIIQIVQPEVSPSTRGISSGIQLCTGLRPCSCAVFNVNPANLVPLHLLYIPSHPHGAWGYVHLNVVPWLSFKYPTYGICNKT